MSLTAILCTFFGHIIVAQIWEHLNQHKIISPNQHGFRLGLSCETLLVEALYDWTKVMNRGSGQVDSIVLDFIGAFGVVPHKNFLQKLNS